MSGVTPGRRDPAHLGFRGPYRRAAASLLLALALATVVGCGIAYLIAAPEVAKDYYSAHATAKNVGSLLLPALAIGAAAVLVLAGTAAAVVLMRYTRRLREPLLQVDELLQKLGAGSLPPAVPAGPQPDPLSAAAAHLEPLRQRVADLERLSRSLQKLSLEMNYRTSGASEVTLKDLRAAAAQLDAISKELGQSVAWFGG